MTRIPAWTWSCAIIVALGVAVTSVTAFLSESILWRPLGVRDEAGLVRLGVAPIGRPNLLSSVSFPVFDELFSGHESLAGIAAWSMATASYVPAEAPPVKVRIELVTPNFFEVVGVPIRGRALGPERESNPAVVASAHFVRRHFGRAEAALGRTIRVNDAVVTIVGVADGEYAGLGSGGPPDLMLEVSQGPVVLAGTFSPDALVSRSYNVLLIVARLAPGHSLETVQAELDARAAHVPQSIDRTSRMIAVHPAFPRVGSNAERLRTVACGAIAAGASVAALVTLNFAALILIRIERRFAEFGVRQMLGATRGAIAGLLLRDVLVVALLGFALAAAMAWAIMALLADGALVVLPLAPDWMPPWPRAAAIVAGITVAVTFAATAVVLIAWRRSSDRRSASSGIAVTHTTRRGATPWLVAGQFAASMLLLYPAAKATEQIVELLRVDLGVARLDARVLGLEYDGTGERTSLHARAANLLASVRQHPDVAHAALGSMLPISYRNIENTATVGGGEHSGEAVRYFLNEVSDGFLAAAGIRLVSGGEFVANETRRVVIVSRALAERYWPGSSPIGSTLADTVGVHEIIGVADDVKYLDPFGPPPMVVYSPIAHAQVHGWTELVVAPAAGAGERVPALLRDEYARFSPARAMAPVLSIGERLEDATASIRLVARVLNVLGILTLGMAATSAYAALTQYVLQRRREIAVRKALGATSARLCRMLLLEGIAIALLGLFAGAMVGGLLLQLYPVPSLGRFDSQAALLVMALALLAALLAGLGPARRAALVEPQVALRDER